MAEVRQGNDFEVGLDDHVARIQENLELMEKKRLTFASPPSSHLERARSRGRDVALLKESRLFQNQLKQSAQESYNAFGSTLGAVRKHEQEAAAADKMQKMKAEEARLARIAAENEAKEKARVEQERRLAEEKEKKQLAEEARAKQAAADAEAQQQQEESKRAEKQLLAVQLAKRAYITSADDLIDRITQIQEHTETWGKQPANKRIKMDIKKAVGLRVGQIAASQEVVQRVSRQLIDALQQWGAANNRDLEVTALSSSSQKPEVMLAAYHFASRMVEQCEVQTISNASFAWPLAYVANNVFQVSPLAKEYFKGEIFKRCRYVIPYYVPKTADMSVSDWKKARGQLENESEDRFFKRMVGYLRLWFAVLVVSGDFDELWLWFARFLNNSPRHRIAPFVLMAALDIAAFDGLHVFKGLFSKLVDYIQTHYLPLLDQLVEKSADNIFGEVERVKLWLKTFHQGGLKVPAGKQIHSHQTDSINAGL